MSYSTAIASFLGTDIVREPGTYEHRPWTKSRKPVFMGSGPDFCRPPRNDGRAETTEEETNNRAAAEGSRAAAP